MAMAMGGIRRRDWSGLPLDLLGAIFNCLSIPDRLRVRAVCHGWWVASGESPYRPTNPQPPWLVGTCADVYALSEHRSYRLNNIPARCMTSSHGWLVLAYDPPDRMQFRLLNPITGVTIDLPSPTTLPRPSIYPTSSSSSLYCIKVKVFFSDHDSRGEKNKNNNIMVFASCCSGINKQNCMAYANAGDQVWTPIGEPAYSFRGMADFTFHKGKLYGVFDNSHDGTLVVIMDVNPTSSPPRYVQPRWHPILKSLHLCTRWLSYHLMDSVDGEDLLLVLASLPPFHFIPFFWVMKLDPEAQLWLPIRRLEDQTAIFLGANRSMSLSTRALPELKENCIYFTKSRCRIAAGDEGIFHLQDGSISPLFPHHYTFTSSLHHWFTPAL